VPIVEACRVPTVVIIVRDEHLVPSALAAGTLGCSTCGGRLRKWGFARPRCIRPRDGGRVREQPARSAAPPSRAGAPEVLPPARCVPRRCCDADTIGAGLLRPWPRS